MLHVAQNRRVDARLLRQVPKADSGVHAHALAASTRDPGEDQVSDFPRSAAEAATDPVRVEAGATVSDPALAVTQGT
jgi:hypothetical protein